MRRGAILILGAVLSAAFASAAGAQGRFVQACEVAVLAHAGEIELDFPHAELSGNQAKVDFSFENGGESYSGEALCVFRSPVPNVPPSLMRFEVLGRTNAAMFLVGHHAVWEYFSGGPREETASTPPDVPDDEPDANQPSKRRMIASAGQ